MVAISLGSLQRLIALKAVPHSAVSRIIGTMGDAMSQGVDIQLRILQTLVSLITNFPAIHGGLLGEVCSGSELSVIYLISYPGSSLVLQTSRVQNCSCIINSSSYSPPTRHVRCGQDGC